jgi:hypothetical protein
MEKVCWIRSLVLTGLLVLSLPLSNASAVTIDLRPAGPTTIGVGETLNVEVFMLLDSADQAAGISAATLHLEGGAAFVSVTDDDGAGSPFPTHAVNVVPPPNDFVVFSQFGTIVTSPEAMLGTLFITGVNPGSYDLVARRFGSFPLFTAPGQTANRYDFASDEALTIRVPEAGTLVLLGASLAGLAFLRRWSV